tara:strand:+ start:899 stop:1297 length:399 start_codon:yes stop_codon:yes gene_type:complete
MHDINVNLPFRPSDLLEIARDDVMCISLGDTETEMYMYKGIKIVKALDDIRIYNTTTFSLNYQEISEDDYYFFFKNGFKPGVKYVLRKTYKDKINKINDKIQDEVNNRNNKKHYDALKVRRDNLINKYSKLK